MPIIVPIIVKRQGKEIKAYHLSELLRKAKRESKTVTDRSWSTFDLRMTDTILQKPDLPALRLWWEPSNPLNAEAFNKDGLFPLLVVSSDIDINDLPSEIVTMISDEGKEKKEEEEKEKKGEQQKTS